MTATHTPIHRMTNDEVRRVWFTPDGKTPLDLAREINADRDPWDSASEFVGEMFDALDGKREVELADDDPLHSTFGDAVDVIDLDRDGDTVALLLDSDQAVDLLRSLCHAAALMDTDGAMADELLPEVEEWGADNKGVDDADLWNDLLYGHAMVDQEASPEYDQDSAVVCWDGSRIHIAAGEWMVAR